MIPKEFALREPSPLWPDAPRYCPHRELPAYRFVPGKSPHPNRDPQGHSYGIEEKKPAYLPPARWKENELYLFGIDLYHHSYFWEAHEAWEVLWKWAREKNLEPRTNPECEFLQGLIQNSAAQLKLHLENWKSTAHLSQEAYRRFQFVETSGECKKGRFMGIDVPRLIRDMERHYGPLWHAGPDQPKRQLVSPPRLELAII